MWIKNGGLFSAVLAVLAAGVVSLGSWFSLAHDADVKAFFDSLSQSEVGAVTLAIVLLAGWLLAVAFDRAEESFVLYKQRSSDSSGAGD
jgi:hypothetical protein